MLYHPPKTALPKPMPPNPYRKTPPLTRFRKILAALGLALAIYVGVAYRIAAGVTAAERVELEGDPSDFGRPFEHVRFPSRRADLFLDGWYMPGNARMPVIVFVHGISANRTTGGMTELASMLNARGFGALLFDLRGHGRSEGDRVSGGWHERMDVLGARDYLVRRGACPSQIGVIGVSMGAASAALAAAEQPDIRALALDSPFARAAELVNQEVALVTSIPAWLSAVFKPLGVLIARRLYGIDLRAISPEDAVRKLDYPIFVIHGSEDDRVPPEHSRRVYRASPRGSRVWVLDDIAHAGAFSEGKREYADKVADYFLSRLSDGGRG